MPPTSTRALSSRDATNHRHRGMRLPPRSPRDTRSRGGRDQTLPLFDLVLVSPTNTQRFPMGGPRRPPLTRVTIGLWSTAGGPDHPCVRRRGGFTLRGQKESQLPRRGALNHTAPPTTPVALRPDKVCCLSADR